ncbi:MAG: hypothetical protein ACRCU5_13865 [Rhizobiaceae bacterium]
MANTQFDTLPKRKSIALISSVPTQTASKVVRLWLHATTLAAATVLTADYFDGNPLRVNDIIIVMAVADGVGDMLILKVTAVADTTNFTGIAVAVNSEASGT